MRHVGLSILVLMAGVLFSLACASSDPPPPPIPAAPPPPPPKPVDPRDFKADISFDAGSARLSDAGQAELSSFASRLSRFPKNNVQVTGYGPADAKGAERWLPEQRAKSTASYLVSQGIPIDHVTLQQREATGGSGIDAAQISGDVEVRVR